MRDRTEGPRQIVARDSDVNWDGRFDVRSTFSEQTGQLEREEMDGDFDGRVDWIDHYQGGRRVLSEVDADNDGKMDLFKIFENGKLRRKERDTNADGKIDFWEYLDESGNVVKVGRDVDGDGVMDVRND
jgi:antitoxin component YwqK of YwqJK toxin-antitoxin module